MSEFTVSYEKIKIVGKRIYGGTPTNREIRDWLRLCATCHRRYDKSRGLGAIARRYGLPKTDKVLS